MIFQHFPPTNVWEKGKFDLAIKSSKVILGSSFEQTSFGRANLSAFRTLVLLAFVLFCLFPLPLGVWEGMQFVTVALPGLFSYLFW